jgi:hypothetical protein
MPRARFHSSTQSVLCQERDLGEVIEKNHLRNRALFLGAIAQMVPRGPWHTRGSLGGRVYTRFLTLGLATSSRPIEIKVNETNRSTMITTGSRIHHHIPRRKAE